MNLSFDEKTALMREYTPLLVLYPEIGTTPESSTRVRNPDYPHEAPLEYDYHPRDVRLVLDHARLPERRYYKELLEALRKVLGLGRNPLHDGDKLLEALERRSPNQIDILEGKGHRDRKKFWAEYYRIIKRLESHVDDDEYRHMAYVHFAYGDDLPATIPSGDTKCDYSGLIAIEYWFIYLYNDWRATHEGDWELAVVFLRQPSEIGGEPEPIGCAYSAHHGGY